MLDEQTRALAQEVRALLGRGLEALAKAGLEAAPLQQALLDLEGPFLLVVAGEFNSGKSSLINALLEGDFLKEGVTPTTDRIYLIGYGPEPRLEPQSPGLVHLNLPHPLLKEVRLVDTPGTNAILPHHQLLTERFLPRADLILFLTSADRPLTQSEADFLQFIQAWGKKVVLVINKIDLLTEAEQEEVEAYVRKGVEKTLGHPPPVFRVSARQARRGERAGSGVLALEAHIQRVLAEDSARLKLGSPLGVLLRLLQEGTSQLKVQKAETEQRFSACRELEQMLQRHEERTRRDFQGQVALSLRVVEEVRERGERWLDEKVRLSRFFELLQSQKLKQSFLEEVVRGANQEIERRVMEALRWLARRERELLEDALTLLREAPGPYPSPPRDQEELTVNLEEALRSFDAEAEANHLRDYIQESLRGTALAEVGVVGLGLTFLLVVQKIALDILGIVATVFGAILATSILPRRKEAAKARLRERLSELRASLERALEETLRAELEQSRGRFQRLYQAPCARLEAQLKGLQEHLDGLQVLEQEAQRLQQKLGLGQGSLHRLG
ncbi:GTP-binding protein [Meiothermus sp. QL-1]|uniref:dynamin family protein n=1 Tax=Meiothermus sp. QL-1 TaxID=2058095 RepID=UPI000E0AE2B0|nr:dynamin family protein [Meiothermus sp. QL-1]RDI95117.1 GTP-binding protein [Meiothermus sp. QL-1]